MVTQMEGGASLTKAFINTTALTVHDVTGLSDIGEAAYGVDTRDAHKLSGTEKAQRYLTGSGKVILAGVAVKNAFGKVKPTIQIKKIKGGKVNSYGPTNPGPLNDATAATFRSGSYKATTVNETTTLYRSYGGNANKLGSYWTRIKPRGPLQAQLDSALAPKWGNTARNTATMKIPKGTTIYEGAAAPQSAGAGQIWGGGNQVYIPKINPKWIAK